MKLGTPQDRTAVAAFAREQRARFSTLHGGWTHRQWNHQIAVAVSNRLATLTRVRRLSAADLNLAAQFAGEME